MRRVTPIANRRGLALVWMILIVLAVMAVAVVIGAFLGFHTAGVRFTGSISEVFSPPFGGKKIVRILVLGEDDTGGRKAKPRGLSDTIILASIDIETKHMAALSIPRDTQVDLDGYGGVCKINAAHVYGGPTLAALAVEQLVGVKPDYYLKTNVPGFKKSVDILGGIDLYVEKNMRYTDRWGGLYINLKKGYQHLDGDKAMQYVRFRHDALGDIARIERQQKFMKALAKKALSPSKLPKLPRVVAEIQKNVQTDMTARDMVFLARYLGRLDFNNVRMEMLPGAPQNIRGISYWIPDQARIAEAVQELFFPQLVVHLPKVEVLNGSGIAGAAQQVAAALRERGYEVTSVGNAESFDYASSEIITHTADVQDVNQIASIVNSSSVRHQDNSTAKADVTIIIGKDYMPVDSGT